jgi:hypothetical protein
MSCDWHVCACMKPVSLSCTLGRRRCQSLDKRTSSRTVLSTNQAPKVVSALYQIEIITEKFCRCTPHASMPYRPSRVLAAIQLPRVQPHQVLSPRATPEQELPRMRPGRKRLLCLGPSRALAAIQLPPVQPHQVLSPRATPD